MSRNNCHIKMFILYITILFVIAIVGMFYTNNNIQKVRAKTELPTTVTEQSKNAGEYPINNIPKSQNEQEMSLETIVEYLEEESEPDRVYLGAFELTAYCSCEKCCGKWAKNRPIDENGREIVMGSAGDRLYQGISIAVDPTVIPYGSKVIIGDNLYIAHDCGGNIKGNRIDIYFDNHSDALKFGRQQRDVYVLAS